MTSPLAHRYLTQPHEVSIETLALCNAACVFCPYPTLERKGARLHLDAINNLIEQMSTWREPFFVSPFKVNEPLLDVRLQDICEDIIEHCPKATLRLFTNGQPLAGRHIDWISALPVGRVEHLWVSLNSVNPTEYGELMKCSYSIVHDHLHELHARLAQGTFPHPVIVSRVVQGGGSALTPTARLLSERDASFHRDVLTQWPRFQSILIKRDAWLGYVTPSDPRVPNTACGRWFELSITAEGQVVQCCMDGKGEYVYGNCVEQTLLEIYNSPAYRNFRERSTRKGAGSPCAQCSY